MVRQEDRKLHNTYCTQKFAGISDDVDIDYNCPSHNVQEAHLCLNYLAWEYTARTCKSVIFKGAMTQSYVKVFLQILGIKESYYEVVSKELTQGIR